MGVHSYFSRGGTSKDQASSGSSDGDVDAFIEANLEEPLPKSKDIGVGSQVDDVDQDHELWKDGRYQYIDVPLGRFLEETDDEPSMLSVTTVGARARSGRGRSKRNKKKTMIAKQELAILLPSMGTLLFVDPSDSSRPWSTLRLPELPQVNCTTESTQQTSGSTAEHLGGWITEKLGLGAAPFGQRSATSKLSMQVLPSPSSSDCASKLLITRPKSDTVVVLDLGGSATNGQVGKDDRPLLHEIVLPKVIADAGGLQSVQPLSEDWWLVEDMLGNALYANVHVPAATTGVRHVRRPDGSSLRMGPAASVGLGGRQNKYSKTTAGGQSNRNERHIDGRVPHVTMWTVDRLDILNGEVEAAPLNLSPLRGTSEGSVVVGTPVHLQHDPKGHSSRLICADPLTTHLQLVDGLPLVEDSAVDAATAMRRARTQQVRV